ncbi:hypothetical protein AMK59_6659, partial [Oryctes borbonicus]
KIIYFIQIIIFIIPSRVSSTFYLDAICILKDKIVKRLSKHANFVPGISVALNTDPTSYLMRLRSTITKTNQPNSLFYRHFPYFPTYSAMVDDKVEMNNDSEAYATANTNDPKNVQELTQYVQSLLQTIQDKFQNMSEQILSRIDEMGNRMEDLEKNIGDLMTQAGVESGDK